MFKLAFFVPADHAEAVKEAVFASGAGTYRNYDRCSWETSGTGQFRPSAESTPYIGERGRVERVAELRVEILCDRQTIRHAVEALLGSHPYEEVAYEVTEVFHLEELAARFGSD